MKGILFDMDGVLFDTERVSLQAFNDCGAEFGIAMSQERWCSLCGTTFESYKREMLLDYGASFDLASFEASRANLIKERLDLLGVPKKEGLLETLQNLKDMGFAMAVASSTKKSEVCRLLQNAGILSFFSAIIGGDSVSNSKPAPDPYIAAAHALELEPSECFAVEDSKAGIKSANAAGCAVIMLHDLTAPDCETKALTVATAESLRELVEIIGELGKGSCFNEL